MKAKFIHIVALLRVDKTMHVLFSFSYTPALITFRMAYSPSDLHHVWEDIFGNRYL